MAAEEEGAQEDAKLPTMLGIATIFWQSYFLKRWRKTLADMPGDARPEEEEEGKEGGLSPSPIQVEAAAETEPAAALEGPRGPEGKDDEKSPEAAAVGSGA